MVDAGHRSHTGQGPGNEDMLGDLSRNQGEVNDFTGPLYPAPGQAGTALGTGFQDMLHPAGGSHAPAGKAVGAGASWDLYTWLDPGRTSA